MNDELYLYVLSFMTSMIIGRGIRLGVPMKVICCVCGCETNESLRVLCPNDDATQHISCCSYP